jgi:hypothetical protein
MNLSSKSLGNQIMPNLFHQILKSLGSISYSEPDNSLLIITVPGTTPQLLLIVLFDYH